MLAPADVLVAVDPGADGRAAVVEVEGLDPLEADRPVERLPSWPRYSRAVAQRIAGGEDVAGVEADAQPVGVLHAVEDRGQVLESPAERGSLAGRGFQQAVGLDGREVWAWISSSARTMRRSPSVSLAGGVGAGMGDDVGDAQRLGPVQFDDKRVDRSAARGPRRGWPG